MMMWLNSSWGENDCLLIGWCSARKLAPSHPFFSLSLRGGKALAVGFALHAANRLFVLSSKGRGENIIKNTRGLLAIVRYEI